jgi:hypothetical protein
MMAGNSASHSMDGKGLNGATAKAPTIDVEVGESKDLGSTKGLDIGASFAGYLDDHEPYTEQEAKLLRWKLDLFDRVRNTAKVSGGLASGYWSL